MKVGDIITFDGHDSVSFTFGKDYTIMAMFKMTLAIVDDHGTSHSLSYKYVEANFLHNLCEIVTNVPDELGAKFDGGKLLFRPLMHGLALPIRAVAAVLSYGAQKYAEDSWQEVPNAKVRYENALYRHQNAREAGEIYDDESGLPHRAHEICNAMFLLWFDIKDGTITNVDKFNEPPHG